VELAQGAGFTNLSIDLIYGIPALDHSIWLSDLARAFALGVQHISSYGLTIEPGTALGRWTKTGRFNPSTDDFTAEQFEILLSEMERNGFEQYEISNFCRPGFESRHNSNYWRGVSYLGLGPSAHSFNGTSRQHNVANNAAYLKSIAADEVPATLDELSPEDQVNEYLLTSLRTKWGADLNLLQTRYHVNLPQLHAAQLTQLSQQGLLTQQGNHLLLTNAGKLLADGIAARLFV
jgi:oxygen-independent coproporphyrinogen-3 oxidase